MSKSPKALLPSSLTLSTISRALPTSAATGKYSVRTVALAVGSKAAGKGQAPGGFIVVRQRRASPFAGAVSSSARSGGAGQAGGSGQAGPSRQASGSRGQVNAVRTSGGLLRTGGGVSTSASSSSGSRALAGYFGESASSSRGFHTSSRTPHQQAVAPSSSGIAPPPGGAGGAGAGGVSPPGSSAAEGHPFHPKHHSSLATPSHDGPLLLGPSAGQGGHGTSLPTVVDPSSSSPISSQSTHASSSKHIPATFFTQPPPASFPSHALPAFFGSALNIARRSNLVFRNGAYGIPKSEYSRARKASDKGKEKMIVDEEEHYLSVGVGEDSYFLRSDSLGVADGVGGWSHHAGANSARWARKFMHHCSAELARYENIDDELFLRYYEVDPVDVMQRAYEKTLHECKEEGTIGSSTALLAILRNDELRLANLGDCSCFVIRGDEYVFRSEEQQHRFNYPFQAGTNAKDTPAKDAQRFNVKVRRDDIVILASDGLVDNVFSDDLLEEVLRFVGTNPPTVPSPPSTSNGSPSSKYTLRRFSPQAVSEALCFRAKSVYEDQRAVASPFQQRAMEEGIHYAGGKIDDVSCLVGVVGELEAAPNRRDVQ